mgnify:CR=1 FL=1
MGCRLTEKRWKILLAIVLAAVSLVVGFIVGTTVVPASSSTVYSTDPQQCPTDATFCESVNVWRRASDAGLQAPNALNKKSSALVDA